tara:strand:- start:624 stop:1340 length:717 start_codon:yes stop_codon:yes gene_type:complete
MTDVSVDSWRVYGCGENRKMVGQNQNEGGGTVVSDMFHQDQAPVGFRLREEDLSVLISRLEDGGYKFLSLRHWDKTPIAVQEKKLPVAHWLSRSVKPDEARDILEKAEELSVDFGQHRGQGVFFQSETVSLVYGDALGQNQLTPSLEGAGQLSPGDEQLLVAFVHFNQACPSTPFVTLASESGDELELGRTYSSLKQTAGQLGFDLKKIRALAESSRLVEPLVNLAALKPDTDESPFF